VFYKCVASCLVADEVVHRKDTDTAMPGSALTIAEQRAKLERMHPFRGLGKPDDMAKAAVFLASEDNSWITGIGLPVDGGFLAM
jgi:NAD(P)-dependent dehydrogenase (short-subunit alcohol dehydrogenase family)